LCGRSSGACATASPSSCTARATKLFVEIGRSPLRETLVAMLTLARTSPSQPGAPPGDLVFVLQLKPHPTFTQSATSEYDLLTTVRAYPSFSSLADRALLT
jgi:hypothetical protein